ncbi:S-adenosyl-L-methionine-dependent methyltransferase [Mollisia scopiformis]|uniref:S-adenosyl-L-methionine-dependent methyltransferase n=1 Tax=Mollisia scopiformis TaxID=149040 RepID=A0A194WTM4_MOLSC|nr:S-adenosyl-L-methionine-dependent methyltransferase [Mollisia scopiformis]KUJ10962.1 S-adenosyl-L-methionine-dependent methyltransferase [Mollisia scopiformis]
MSEAAFFYNTTTQRPDRTKPPSAHTNISQVSQAQPVKPIFKKSHPHSAKDTKQSTRQRASPSSTSTDSHSSHSARTTPHHLEYEQVDPDSMLSTPLPDYKHAANQTNKARAAAQVAQANRKSSSTSGNSAERKHALQVAAAEARAAATARFESGGRSSSLSSTTGSSGLTAVTSSDPPSVDEFLARPFSRRNGRRCLRDMTLPYPLPCDLAEIHRQILRTMLLCQVFNGPVCSPAFHTKPPKRVLEVGCGTGFWSIMCHKHFSRLGFSSISFTGVDIAPLAPRMESDDDMNWRFVQHDLRRVPFPFRDDEFNLIMIKDMSLTTPTTDMQQTYMDEYLRILKPGGTLEIWDGDHSLRMLLPHAPPSISADDEESEDEEQVHTNAMGTYTLTPQTPLAAPQSTYLNDYNTWVSKALEARKLNPMPCTTIRPMLLQESDLTEIDSRRLAIPLGEVRWEREGVGGAVTQGTNGHAISSKGKSREGDRKTLTAGQAALRRTALMTVVQMIESLEPLLREASGKGQDEWDRWQGNMMNDLLKQNGTSWGECLEVGAWWARKKKPPG